MGRRTEVVICDEVVDEARAYSERGLGVWWERERWAICDGLGKRGEMDGEEGRSGGLRDGGGGKRWGFVVKLGKWEEMVALLLGGRLAYAGSGGN